MQIAISETARRRDKQMKYNTDNNITPKTIKKNIDDIMISTSVADGYKKSEQKEKRSDKDRFKEYF